MDQFFSDDLSDDPLYEAYRTDELQVGAETACQFIERIWSHCARFLDPDVRLQARHDFLARYWELYLAWTLLSRGVALEERDGTDGPDFRLLDPPVWLEAIRANPGTGPDAVPEAPSSGAHRVPDAEIKLRLRNAIETKSTAFRRYVRNGAVPCEDPVVIAVSAAGIRSARTEMDIPRIVRVLLPFGDPVVTVDVRSMDIVEQGYSYRGTEQKRSGAPVSTNVFLDRQYRHVSGVLYAATDPLNRPGEAGDEFVMVHNPYAMNRLPRGLFPFGREYWVDGAHVKSRRHVSREVSESVTTGTTDN